jgi:hypothetical protein
MLLLFMLIENRFIEIVSSDALVFEKSQNPHDDRRMFVSLVLQKATINRTTIWHKRHGCLE